MYIFLICALLSKGTTDKKKKNVYFSCHLSQKIFLKRKLYPVHWLGMLVTMGGLILVGCSSVFQSTQSTSGSKTLLGESLDKWFLMLRTEPL